MGIFQGLGHSVTFCVAVLLVSLSSLIIYGGGSTQSTTIFAAVILAASLAAVIISFVLMTVECCFPDTRNTATTSQKKSDIAKAFGQFFNLFLFVLSIVLASIIISQGPSNHTQSTITFSAVILAISSLGAVIISAQFAYVLVKYFRNDERTDASTTTAASYANNQDGGTSGKETNNV